MVADASGRFRRQQVARGGFEEFQYGLVFPDRRIGHIHDHIGIVHGFGQPRSGDAVHSRVRGSCEGVMASLAENLHKLCSNEAGASEDNDFHGFLRSSGGRDCRRC
ncbi:hypothetical protein D9M68_710410 [compost metagenome]